MSLVIRVQTQKRVLAWKRSRHGREEKEANRRAEEAVAQQYRRTRRRDARKNPRNEQRGYKDTSVYTEEGYRLN